MNQIQSDELKNEWSYVVQSDEIVSKVTRLKFEASQEECAALAKRLNVERVDQARAQVEVKRNSGNMVVYVSGRVEADIVQKCVVTLEPVEIKIEEDFESWYADPAQAVSFAKEKRRIMAQKHGEETPILEEKDDPEPIENGAIDLGELATQYMILGVDPYPHAPGVHYEVGDDDPPKDDPSFIRKNPFEKLKEWKEKI